MWHRFSPKASQAQTQTPRTQIIRICDGFYHVFDITVKMPINCHLSVHNSQACQDESVVFFPISNIYITLYFKVSSTLLRNNRNTVFLTHKEISLCCFLPLVSETNLKESALYFIICDYYFYSFSTKLPASHFAQ